MRKLVKLVLGGSVAKSATELVGPNPLLQLGAAGLATRIVAGSIPLGLLLWGSMAMFKKQRTRKPRAMKRAATSRKAIAHSPAPKQAKNTKAHAAAA
jgi:hypothetical protein